ncbi:MAG TPA: FIST N-terminal domain-containing protein [Candidatus Ozemobacteraceae bacterium]|nr:FIST N-terminal domain-containing protein [Candidatus Ozemobacteraceae bacterium]
MRTIVAFSRHSDSLEAIRELVRATETPEKTKPQLLFYYATIGYDETVLMNELSAAFPDVPMHGGTSCQGIMTHRGALCTGDRCMGLLALFDPDGAYGVGMAPLGAHPRTTGVIAGREALKQANREGEIPTMVWVTNAPGHEEEVLAGLEDLFGPNVPICGGSSADDDLTGQWKQFANGRVHENAAVVAVLFSPGQIGFSFHSGYDPTTKMAVITRCEGRTIQELDGRKAAHVYNEWLDNRLADLLPTGGNLMQRTALHPLGRVAGLIGEIPYFQLSHPATMTREGGLTLFTGISPNEKVWLMQGTQEGLVKRAERAARSAVDSLSPLQGRISGAMVMFCAGCMFIVRERMNDVVAGLRRGLGDDVPFLGAFTYGEQGCFVGGENRHGNFMVSLLVFTE